MQLKPGIRAMCCAVPLGLAIFPSGAGAATITPDIFTDELNTSNAVCSLREAIDIANANTTIGHETECDVDSIPGLGNDTVQLAAGGPYVLSVTGALENANASGDLDATTAPGNNLTLNGAGAAMTTIDTADAPAWTERVLHNATGSTGLLSVTNLTVTDGHAGGAMLDGAGGGIQSDGGSLSLVGARVTANDSVVGGGGVVATNNSSSLTIMDSTVDMNSTTGTNGGGIVSSATGTTTIDSSVIEGNAVTAASMSASGGGMSIGGTTLTLTDSVVAENSASRDLSMNSALGGGLSFNGSSATIKGTTFVGNEVLGGAAREGGGIQACPSAPSFSLALVNSTVSGNEALGSAGNGAGLSTACGTTTVAHSTFGPNPVNPGGASAVYQVSGTLSIRGSTVETHLTSPACVGTIVSLDDNVFTDSSCGPEPGPGGNDDVDADPQLGLLQDNGGPDVGAPGFLEPIPTHLPPLTSPVIDHVPATDCDDHPAGSLTVDQRGFIRPTDTDGNSVAECEAGSVEVPFPTPPVVIPVTPPLVAAPAPAAPRKCRKGFKLKKGKCKRKRKRR